MPRIADETCWQEQLLSDPCFSESWASVQESRADADVEPLPQSGVLKSWAERWDSKEAFKTLGHFETLSSRPDPKNVRSIGLPWFAAWNCEAEIAVGSIWAASAGCSWDPVPGTEVPQMQMPWVQLWSSYGSVMASESTEPVFIESKLELRFFKQFLVDDKVMTSFCDWVSFQNAEKITHIKRLDYGYRYHMLPWHPWPW